MEIVPSGVGPLVQGAAKKKSKKLSAKVQRRLRQQGGSDATVLKQIATSAALGAPVAPKGAEASSDATLSSGSSSSNVKVFAISGLLLLAVLAAAALWRFRRVSPRSTA